MEGFTQKIKLDEAHYGHKGRKGRRGGSLPSKSRGGRSVSATTTPRRKGMSDEDRAAMDAFRARQLGSSTTSDTPPVSKKPVVTKSKTTSKETTTAKKMDVDVDKEKTTAVKKGKVKGSSEYVKKDSNSNVYIYVMNRENLSGAQEKALSSAMDKIPQHLLQGKMSDGRKALQIQSIEFDKKSSLSHSGVVLGMTLTDRHHIRIAKGYFQEGTESYNKNSMLSFEHVILHEASHAIFDSRTMPPTGARAEVKAAFSKTYRARNKEHGRGGWLNKTVSEYATVNSLEYLAESFATMARNPSALKKADRWAYDTLLPLFGEG